jgi:hypothetical protein
VGTDPSLVPQAVHEALDGLDLLGLERPEGILEARVVHIRKIRANGPRCLSGFFGCRGEKSADFFRL